MMQIMMHASRLPAEVTPAARKKQAAHDRLYARDHMAPGFRFPAFWHAGSPLPTVLLRSSLRARDSRMPGSAIKIEGSTQ